MTQHSPELQRLVDIGQLDLLPPVSREIAQLITSGQRRLQDASMLGLSVESRFALTYGAAHSLSLAALRQRGYRSKNRYVVFQALEHTLGLSPSKWRVLAKAHGR